MKRKKLEKELVALGWMLKRNGANHDVWWNGDTASPVQQPIPRHPEINELTAKSILKKARKHKGKK